MGLLKVNSSCENEIGNLFTFNYQKNENLFSFFVKSMLMSFFFTMVMFDVELTRINMNEDTVCLSD